MNRRIENVLKLWSGYIFSSMYTLFSIPNGALVIRCNVQYLEVTATLQAIVSKIRLRLRPSRIICKSIDVNADIL